MIIRPKRYAGLFMALIIEFIMVPFYIYAASLKLFLVEMGIVQILVLGVVLSIGKTIILNEKGCCLSWLNGLIRKEYDWEQLKTKRVLYKTDRRESYGFEAEKCVLLSTRIIKNKSVWNNPFVQSEKYTEVEKGADFVDNLPFIFKPINIIYIYFNPGIGKSDKDGSCYEMVDEKVFMEKMAEWHVELEDNRPEEIPPWKEQI